MVFLPKLEVFSAAARSNMNNTSAFRLANLIPQDHLVSLDSVQADSCASSFRSGVPANFLLGRQLIERAIIGPALHLAPFSSARPRMGRAECAACPWIDKKSHRPGVL